MDRSQRHLFLLAFVAIAAIVAIVSMTYRLPEATLVSGEAIAAANVQEAELTVDELGYAPDRVIVGFTAGVSEAEQEKILRGVGATNTRDLKVAKVITVPPQARAHVQEALQKRKGVAFAEEDFFVTVESLPNDPLVSSQYHINLMRFPQAWNVTGGGGTVRVAAPDTGIDANHPDLAPVLLMSLAKNTYDGTNNVQYTHNHGVKTAGVIGAATNNGIGIAGAAWNVQQIPLKITNLETGGAYSSDMAEAIRYAADNGARVVSLSYGPSGAASYDTSSTIRSAGAYLESKGGLLFVSAGNAGGLLPVGNAPEILLIGATTSSDTKASFSNYGEPIDLVAPGSSVYTTQPGGGYGGASGTSFSSPLAASVAAMLYAANPGATPNQVRDALINGAVDLGAPGKDDYYGHGRVDALGAITAFGQTPVDNTAPSVSFTAPSNGATIACAETARVSTSDSSGVDRVELRANGQLFATDTQVGDGIAEFYLAPTNLPAGSVTLEAKAFDNAGNAAGATRSVTVQSTASTPSVAITAPSNGETLQDLATITTSTSANVVGVTFYANGQVIGSDNIAPYELSWNTKNYAGQTVSLTATAVDCLGNEGQSSSVSVAVAAATTGGKGKGSGSGGTGGGSGKGGPKNR